MRAADALQVPFVDLLYGDLSPLATKTRFGVAFVAMTLGFAIVTALVLLAWILDRPRLLWPAFLIGHRLRVRAVAVGAPGRRAQLDLPHRARRLAAPRRRDPLGRRPRGPRGVRLAARSDAAAERVPRLLPDRDGPRCGARARRHLSLDRPPADALRSLDDPLRPRSARQDRDRLRGARLGGGASLLRARHGSSAARRRGRCDGA